ncbi:THAP domain-containing protein 2-like [Neodiprion virginianus]|uniref:THAP domain-containing protein 2-like n=1 Tax=Neodiprion virginianus TaxID=2961670 RepID=UPI001EE6F6F7|nr:THAP domain-containing protein 2-like [Neodiprion virginianus]XP_046610008.1 THAP domain-containing protein 2-like [Neodiprion virginianus]
MPGCSVPGCHNSSAKGYSMKSFPTNLARRLEWAKMIDRKNWIPNRTSCICEVHFPPFMWEKPRVDGKRKLRHNAVPTMFPLRSKRVNARNELNKNGLELIPGSSKQNLPVPHSMAEQSAATEHCENNVNSTNDIRTHFIANENVNAIKNEVPTVSSEEEENAVMDKSAKRALTMSAFYLRNMKERLIKQQREILELRQRLRNSERVNRKLKRRMEERKICAQEILECVLPKFKF